ncbi:MAG: SIS domain-containing protein [Actinobacteria bacterium]|uniref:Unannotated protein n=1 Tax=freshwater metagenome TaxID=449393 RepID=A0A6J5ZNG4_9ZZZZ|nr:SIS domain-containing protein [Actinomycetota bacterium]
MTTESNPTVGSRALAEELIEGRVQSHQTLLAAALSQSADQIAAASTAIAQALDGGGTVFFAGNGGSAADAQHLVAEFIGRFRVERGPLAAVALGVNPAVISALANDYGFAEASLAREFDGLARHGDVLVVMSTSGRSPNVLAALEVAKARSLAAVAMTGTGHQLDGLADHLIVVDSDVVALIQEIHSVLGHVICEMVERELGY